MQANWGYMQGNKKSETVTPWYSIRNSASFILLYIRINCSFSLVCTFFPKCLNEADTTIVQCLFDLNFLLSSMLPQMLEVFHCTRVNCLLFSPSNIPIPCIICRISEWSFSYGSQKKPTHTTKINRSWFHCFSLIYWKCRRIEKAHNHVNVVHCKRREKFSVENYVGVYFVVFCLYRHRWRCFFFFFFFHHVRRYRLWCDALALIDNGNV